ncbi:GIY-YIG nuclease family protein [Kitasatospora sp. NPDC096147]|uniref:GIY-YIG nuclease family protein n=1 Tax=Kitasatospora sp. NPDC096147 TaxID=3364093 RepID=UPI00380272BC
MDDSTLPTVLAALTRGPRHPVREAADAVPSAAGLYAIHGDAAAFGELGTGGADRPLYVGKAERSLAGRDLRTHFATGRTGSSTLRRTLAALLREPLALRAVPRNPARPDGSATYALAPEGDERLTAWMRARLCISVWRGPAGADLAGIETAVLRAVRPSLNLAGMGSAADPRIRAARAAMAAEARSGSGGDRAYGPG